MVGGGCGGAGAGAGGAVVESGRLYSKFDRLTARIDS